MESNQQTTRMGVQLRSEHALAQLSQLAETRELLQARSAGVVPSVELAEHDLLVASTVLSMRLEPFRSDKDSQAKLIGGAAVAFGLMPMSALDRLPAQPAAIIKECRRQLMFDRAFRGIRREEELRTDIIDLVRELLGLSFS